MQVGTFIEKWEQSGGWQSHCALIAKVLQGHLQPSLTLKAVFFTAFLRLIDRVCHAKIVFDRAQV